MASDTLSREVFFVHLIYSNNCVVIKNLFIHTSHVCLTSFTHNQPGRSLPLPEPGSVGSFFLLKRELFLPPVPECLLIGWVHLIVGVFAQLS